MAANIVSNTSIFLSSVRFYQFPLTFPPLAEMNLDLSTNCGSQGTLTGPCMSDLPRARPDTRGALPCSQGAALGFSSEPLGDSPNLPWFCDSTKRIKRRSVWGTGMIQWMTQRRTQTAGQEIPKKKRQILILAAVKQTSSQEVHQ